MSKCSIQILMTFIVLSACLVFTMPLERVSAASHGHVVAMHMTASPANYSGTCPTTIKFPGWITVGGGPAEITYGVSRSDGGHGNGGRHNFEKPGTWHSPELTSWELGKPGQSFNGWVMIGSGTVKSNKATFHLHCSK